MYRSFVVTFALHLAACAPLHRPDADDLKIDEVLGVRGERPSPAALDGLPVIHDAGQPQASRYQPMNKKFTFSGTGPKRDHKAERRR